MTSGKSIALTIQTFVSKVLSLLFNMLFRFVIALLPRSKSLLISWLQSPSAVILESKKIKSVTVSIVSPSICLYSIIGRRGKSGNSADFIFLGSKITVDATEVMKLKDARSLEGKL